MLSFGKRPITIVQSSIICVKIAVHTDGARISIVASVRVSTPFSDRDHIEYSLFAIGTASEAELSNPKLLMWGPRERFEVIRWLPPLIGDDFLKLRDDPVASVLVKCVKLSLRPVSELPVLFLAHRSLASSRPYSALTSSLECVRPF